MTALPGPALRALLCVLLAAVVFAAVLYSFPLPGLSEEGRRMTVVDSIGAGDTFTGALAAALARGEPLPEAMRWANAAAALSVTGRGAIGGMPTRDAVGRLLEAGEAA